MILILPQILEFEKWDLKISPLFSIEISNYCKLLWRNKTRIFTFLSLCMGNSIRESSIMISLGKTQRLTFYSVNLTGEGLRFSPLIITIINGGKRSPSPVKLTEWKGDVKEHWKNNSIAKLWKCWILKAEDDVLASKAGAS